MSIGTPVLRKTIYVNDASKITTDVGTLDVLIGNEQLTVTTDTTNNILTCSTRQIIGTSRAHISGTMVRSVNVYGQGTAKVSETKPQIGSPVESIWVCKDCLS